MGLAKNIKILREINDLTQTEMGKIAGACEMRDSMSDNDRPRHF